ncbi:MAG: ATP synthase F1 subunit gamma [Candidatus Niyogibacteria bacterium CG10_big_fil_rev_8_21_14_0_10_42_19]|uniref:ATP synthase gamma chain n=1 Tax=Candidatus Niyogibacteria bacterium CG10_big_fil_rev_8_21_14_0_10_42_19 TaxID=1974725 RepID=A0A2H0TEW9_9BACT|nr:MAG: ATP synthase F1 subunit gamma [Candidatus Niyogibacteria bacterium CG10_big_fil_rev_8_21_14_0_10_42_19]
MQSTQSLKRRIRAVINTAQITKAMEMVAANKMRKSQVVALNSRPYAIKSLELLRELTKRTSVIPSLMKTPETKKENKPLIILICADKGLAGSFNSNVFRKFEKKFGGEKGSYVYAAVGKKAEEYLSRKNIPAQTSFIKFGDHAAPEETQTFANFIIDGFLAGNWSKIITVSTYFRTTLRQDVLIRELLPVTFNAIDRDIKEIAPEHGRFAPTSEDAGCHIFENYGYLIEPTTKKGSVKLIENLSKHLVEMMMYHLILESNASEHSARMVAMKNASDNASELKDDLQLIFNKSRQAGITRELAEITAGANIN